LRPALQAVKALGLLLALALASTLARADEPPPAASACIIDAPFVPPRILWMGRFGYQAVITVKAGQVAGVEVTPVRGGVDDQTNRQLEDALSAYIEAHYRCAGDHKYSQTLVFDLDHDIPPLMADLAPELKERRQAEAAWEASGAAGSAPSATPDPRGSIAGICPQMPRPTMPLPVGGHGVVRIHLLFDVRDGSIGLIDARLRQGSHDFATNQLFIDTVMATVRRGYRCTGTHLLEQDFQFRLE